MNVLDEPMVKHKSKHRRLLRVCSWCKRYHNGTEWVKDHPFVRWAMRSLDSVTHGACPSCLAKEWGRELEELKERNRTEMSAC